MQIYSKRSFSLKNKITGSFFILIFFSSLIIGLYTYYKAKSNIEASVGNTELTIVKSIVNTINIEEFDKLQTNEDMQSQYYKELQGHLADIKSTIGLKYLYTMRKTADGKYVYVVDGTPMDSKDFSPLGSVEEEVSDAMAGSYEGTSGFEYSSDDWGKFISAYIPIKNSGGKVIGILGADFDATNMVNELNKLKTSIILIIMLVAIAGILISRTLSVVLVRSLNNLKAKADLVKSGDLTVKFNSIGNDEIGALAHSFNEMVNNLLLITNEIKNNTKKVTNESNNMYGSVNQTSRASEEITAVIGEIAAGALDQTESVEKVTGAMNEVFEEVKKSVERANLVSDSSNQAMNNTAKALEVFKASIEKVVTVNSTVENTAAIIEELGNKSKEISSFSETISQITKQTNLLSLNAAIEAARAGEEGKGFAVVANEIKALAEQSSNASKQISEIATNMQAETERAIKTIQGGVVQAKEGVNSVTKVDAYLVELQKSSNDAYVRVKEIINSVSLIEEYCKGSLNKIYELAEISKSFSSGSQQAAASTEEQTAIMQHIKENLDNIKNMTCNLNDVVNRFKVN